MKKMVLALFTAAAATGACALERWFMRVPDSLGAVEGLAEFTVPKNDPKAIAIPLKNGSHVVILNLTPYKPGEETYGNTIGVPRKVADGNVVSRMAEAAAKIPTVKVNMGGVTFFAVYEDAVKMYAGKLVSRGGCFMVYVGLPEGRVFDDEIRSILAQVEFVPPADYGIESALKMYGKASLLPAAAKFPVLKKMVEKRAECVELIEALMDAAQATEHADTANWCRSTLARLHPAVYAPDGVNSVKRYNMEDDAQCKAADDLFSADRGFGKATASIPPSGDAPEKTLPKTKTVTLPDGVTMEFIWCEKGTFTMGQNDGETVKWQAKQEPRHKVTLTKGFWLAKYETTQKQWTCIANMNPSAFKGDNLPVDSVSWKLCKAYAERAAERHNIRLRLPTEAEWEYACRAGTRTTYHWGYTPSTKKANYDGIHGTLSSMEGETCLGKTANVGSYEPNPWGFYDMAGNVAEWCEDDWQAEPPAENAKDPLHKDAEGLLKVVRGGCWEHPALACRSSCRDNESRGKKRNWYGVRFVLDE